MKANQKEIRTKQSYLDELLTSPAAGSSLEFTRKLVEMGANVNAQVFSQTPLMNAISCVSDCLLNDFPVVDYLIDQGADVNGATEYGDTPLFVVVRDAFRYHNLELISFLIKKGADIKVMDVNKQTLLHICCFSPVLTKYFIGLGLDVNAEDAGGFTPIMRAGFDNPESFRLLAEAGADIHHMSNEGNLLTDYSNSAEMVEWFLDKGLDASCSDKCGGLPITKLANAYRNSHRNLSTIEMPTLMRLLDATDFDNIK